MSDRRVLPPRAASVEAPGQRRSRLAGKVGWPARHERTPVKCGAGRCIAAEPNLRPEQELESLSRQVMRTAKFTGIRSHRAQPTVRGQQIATISRRPQPPPHSPPVGWTGAVSSGARGSATDPGTPSGSKRLLGLAWALEPWRSSPNWREVVAGRGVAVRVGSTIDLCHDLFAQPGAGTINTVRRRWGMGCPDGLPNRQPGAVTPCAELGSSCFGRALLGGGAPPPMTRQRR